MNKRPEPTLDILDPVTVVLDNGSLDGNVMGMWYNFTKNDWVYSIKVDHENFQEEIEIEGKDEIENPHGDAGMLPPTRFGFQA